MKKSYTFALFAAVTFLFLMGYNVLEKESTIDFVYNPELKTVLSKTEWKGTPIDKKGRFTNLHHSFESSFGDLLKWQLSKNPQKREKKSEDRRLISTFDSLTIQGKDDYLIWLGHASFLIQINGKVYLTDPLLFDNTFLKRESPMPLPLEKFPAIDYLLISHNHRDHLDAKSLKFLYEKNSNVKILTGLGIAEIIKNWGDNLEIQEAGWYQQYNLKEEGIQITYVPSRHWSRRGLLDQNKSLWGGFYIQNGAYSIYFMGDSGHGLHFQEITSALGAPDYCLMGVGAFKPEWFMSQAHISPTDAIEAFNLMEGKYFIPMHFGTFDLSDEPRMEPWDLLLAHIDQIDGDLIEPILGKNLLQKIAFSHP